MASADDIKGKVIGAAKRMKAVQERARAESSARTLQEPTTETVGGAEIVPGTLPVGKA